TFRGVVYLQGRVSKREGDLAARVASEVRGVTRVLTFYEYISEEEAARTSAVQQPSQSPAPTTSAPRFPNWARARRRRNRRRSRSRPTPARLRSSRSRARPEPRATAGVCEHDDIPWNFPSERRPP